MWFARPVPRISNLQNLRVRVILSMAAKPPTVKRTPRGELQGLDARLRLPSGMARPLRGQDTSLAAAQKLCCAVEAGCCQRVLAARAAYRARPGTERLRDPPRLSRVSESCARRSARSSP